MGSNIAALTIAGLKPLEPFDVATRYANLQALAQQRQDAQQRAAYQGQLAQLAGIQVQQAQQEFQDQQTMRTMLPKMLADPQYQTNGAPDFDKIFSSPDLLGKVSWNTASTLRTTMLGVQKTRAEIEKEHAQALQATSASDEERRKAALAFQDHFANWAQDVLDSSNGDLSAALPTLHARLMLERSQPGASAAQLAQIDQMDRDLVQNPSSAMDHLQQAAGMLSQAGREARAKASSEATKATAERRTQAFQALSGLELDQNGQPKDMDAYNALAAQYKGILPQTPGPGVLPRLIGSGVGLKDQPEYQIKQTEAQATKDLLDNPQRVQALVAGAVDPKKYPDEFNRTWNRAMFALQTGGVQAMRQEIDKGGDNVAGLERGITEARITAPIHAAATVAAQKAQYAGTPLENVPVHLVAPAQASAKKAFDSYSSAVDAGDAMQDFIDLARAGNKEAYSYMPTTGVLTINTAHGVKRVNMAEIESYAGAGSALDRVKGWLGKQLTGASVPANVLNDIETLHSQMTANARKTYENNLAGTNQLYGSKFQPVELPHAPRAAAGGAAAHGQAMGGYQVGHVYGGMTYLGGDPKDRASWRPKAQR